MIGILAAAIVGYLLGSIPFGLLLTRAGGLGDIRRIGSGNIGATNVLRTGNKTLAALTLLLDFAKGLAAVLIGGLWGPGAALVAAGMVVLGHMFPVWLGFRGGKGVATALGVLIALAPWVALAAGLVWLATVAIFRYSSLAALVAALLSPLYAWLLTREIQPTEVVAFLALIIILRHHANIRRLFRGEESKIRLGKA